MAVKIMYLIDSLQPGGTERQLLLLAERLDRSRFSPHLGILYAGSVRLDAGTNFPIFNLGFKSFYNVSLATSIFHLSMYIRRNNIQIVQTFFQDATLLAALSKPFHRAKLVGSFRDMGFWRSPLQTWKMRLAYPKFTAFIANSMAVKKHFIKVDNVSSDRIHVIYNCVRENSTRAKEKRRGSSPLTVGMVANLNRKVKRAQDFIKAAARLHKFFPKVRFLIVGDGPLRVEMEALAKSFGLEKNLDFIGSVNEPLKIVRDFDVGVITSESEGFCNAILEYMASGVPVVVTDAGGNSELVEEGKNGFLYPVGDVKTLVQRIVTLLENPGLRKEIGKRNIDKIRKYYSIERALQMHYDFYERVLHGE